jgi:hypothetical protein
MMKKKMMKENKLSRSIKRKRGNKAVVEKA